MVDYHTHVLPEIDDGARGAEESILMLETLRDQGVTTVYATPHFYIAHNTVDEFLKRREASYKKLKEAMEKAGCDFPEVKLGAEVYYFEGISRPENIKEIAKLKMEDTDYVMLEMPFVNWTNRMVNDIITLNESGEFKVMLAHINRYWPNISPDARERLDNASIKLQINCESFDGLFKKKKAIRAFNRGIVHFIGSDCHNMTSRRPRMDIVKAIKRSGLFEKEI